MLVKQILNNNVVSAVDEDGLEVILTGRGWGLIPTTVPASTVTPSIKYSVWKIRKFLLVLKTWSAKCRWIFCS